MPTTTFQDEDTIDIASPLGQELAARSLPVVPSHLMFLDIRTLDDSDADESGVGLGDSWFGDEFAQVFADEDADDDYLDYNVFLG